MVFCFTLPSESDVSPWWCQPAARASLCALCCASRDSARVSMSKGDYQNCLKINSDSFQLQNEPVAKIAPGLVSSRGAHGLKRLCLVLRRSAEWIHHGSLCTGGHGPPHGHQPCFLSCLLVSRSPVQGFGLYSLQSRWLRGSGWSRTGHPGSTCLTVSPSQLLLKQPSLCCNCFKLCAQVERPPVESMLE